MQIQRYRYKASSKQKEQQHQQQQQRIFFFFITQPPRWRVVLHDEGVKKLYKMVAPSLSLPGRYLSFALGPFWCVATGERATNRTTNHYNNTHQHQHTHWDTATTPTEIPTPFPFLCCRFCSILFSSVQFSSVQFCSVQLCSVLFCSANCRKFSNVHRMCFQIEIVAHSKRTRCARPKKTPNDCLTVQRCTNTALKHTHSTSHGDFQESWSQLLITGCIWIPFEWFCD